MSNFKNPSTLEGLSMASILLGMLGNGLMVPRALYTRDKIWFLGVGWGPVMGWVQLLSLYVAHGITGYVWTLCQHVSAEQRMSLLLFKHTSQIWEPISQMQASVCNYLHAEHVVRANCCFEFA